MKKVLVMLTLVAAVSAYSQGTVNFQNRNIPLPDGSLWTARITYGAGVGGAIAPITVGSNVAAVAIVRGSLTYGINARAALYGGAVGVTDEAMQLLVPAVNFRVGSFAGAVNVGVDSSRIISGIGAGTNAWVQVRAWDSGDAAGTNSYESAVALASPSHGVYYGKSEVLQVLLGGGSPPVPPPDLIDNRSHNPLQPLSLGYYVPEPSIIGLGILGAAAGLFLFRRRN